jgi:DNA-binding transcriptional LysR family regulator
MVPLSDRVPDLTSLETLLAVARTGSLSAASQQLGITQQAVSARVRSAESRAGVVLITRTLRGSALTPEGVVAAEWVARLLAVADELDRAGRVPRRSPDAAAGERQPDHRRATPAPTGRPRHSGSVHKVTDSGSLVRCHA